MFSRYYLTSILQPQRYNFPTNRQSISRKNLIKKSKLCSFMHFRRTKQRLAQPKQRYKRVKQRKNLAKSRNNLPKQRINLTKQRVISDKTKKKRSKPLSTYSFSISIVSYFNLPLVFPQVVLQESQVLSVQAPLFLSH